MGMWPRGLPFRSWYALPRDERLEGIELKLHEGVVRNKLLRGINLYGHGRMAWDNKIGVGYFCHRGMPFVSTDYSP